MLLWLLGSFPYFLQLFQFCPNFSFLRYLFCLRRHPTMTAKKPSSYIPLSRKILLNFFISIFNLFQNIFWAVNYHLCCPYIDRLRFAVCDGGVSLGEIKVDWTI